VSHEEDPSVSPQQSICRQRAVFDVEHSWHWLSEAEMWSHKALDEVSAHFRECTATVSSEIAATHV
jgi:hypothetical protein